MEIWKIKFLGAGANGRVFLAAPCVSADDPNTALYSSLMAVKSAKRASGIASLMVEKTFLDELVGSPYIVQCLGDNVSVECGTRVYNMMMEYASGGTLTGLIKERGGRIQESEVACYSAMLLDGLGSAHNKGIVHCDLKPDNILVFPPMEKAYGGSKHHLLKIADFGNARKVWEEETDDDEPGPGRASYHRGTLLYASPESVKFGDHEPACDVWSLGCVILEMLTGQRVWGDSNYLQIIYKLKSDVTPEIPECVSAIGRDFLEKCFERKPKNRWTTHMLMRHQFIQNNVSQCFRFTEEYIGSKNLGGWTNYLSHIDWSFACPQQEW